MVIDLLKFLIVLFVFIFLPGRFVFRLLKVRLSLAETIAISCALGISLLVFISWVLGYLNLRFLVFPILLLADFYLVFFQKWRPKKIRIQRKDYLSIFVVFLGAIFQGLLMFKSGTFYQGGLAFWGVHGYDGIWHAALIQELANHFPPQNPGFAGEALKNYHFFTDLFVAQIHKTTQIPILDLYFRFCPLFFTLLLNSLIFLFAKRWSGRTSIACWSVFFVSMAGSFGWIPQLFGKGSNNWETAFWGIQPTSAFLNPPFGVSLILLLAGLILFTLYLKEKSSGLTLALIFIFGILVGFKVYAGIIILGSLALLGILERKKDILVIFLGGFFLSLLVYLPSNAGSTNFLVWQPWWFIKTMIEAPDRLNWPSLELRRQVYVAYNDWLSLFLLQAMAFLIFLIGNLGTRFIGFFSLVKRILKGSLIDKFLLFILITAFLPPIFFIQKAVPWNSIQFFYYFIFIFSFFAAEATVSVMVNLKFKVLKILFTFLLIAAAIPSTVKTIYWFNAPVPTTLLAKEEIEALDFLKKHSKLEEIILTYPFDYTVARAFKEPPVPMTYYNSPYVSFFTGRRVYLEDQNAATLLGYDVNLRLDKEKDFFQTLDSSSVKNFLKENRISFIYLVDTQNLKVAPVDVGLREIFNNQKVRIYQMSDTI